jgi:hypothetical protein
MNNPIVAIAHFGPVYKRKIHVWVLANSNVPDSEYQNRWDYLHSTNAYRTCRDAIAAAKTHRPAFTYKANFAKD